MRPFFLILACFMLLSATAFADGGMDSPTLKVDLATVVEEGIVEPVDGLTSAAQPDAKALKVFADSGYKTVIDLRTAGEPRGLDEADEVTGLGMNYVALPIAGPDAINFENARKLDALIEQSDGPVLLHCGSANRVGALLALGKSLDGHSDEEALQFGRDAGLSSLEGRVREVLGEQPAND